jgi:hypothetical protein
VQIAQTGVIVGFERPVDLKYTDFFTKLLKKSSIWMVAHHEISWQAARFSFLAS